MSNLNIFIEIFHLWDSNKLSGNLLENLKINLLNCYNK